MTVLDAKEVAWVAQLAGSRNEVTAIGEDDAMATGHEPGLTEAWAAAEAALPEGWEIGLLMKGEQRWVAMAGDYADEPTTAEASGPTLVAALLALAAALRSHTDG